MHMQAAETINTLLDQLVIKGGTPSWERTPDSTYQGIIIALTIYASAHDDDGSQGFESIVTTCILATAYGGNYISVFGADDTNCNPLTIAPEDWTLHARHDSCWTDGTATILRNIRKSLKAECPESLHAKLDLQVSLSNTKAIYTVNLRMPHGEEIGEIIR